MDINLGAAGAGAAVAWEFGKIAGDLVGEGTDDGRVDEVCAGDTVDGVGAAKAVAATQTSSAIALRMWR
jgi:hypothetical protein